MFKGDILENKIDRDRASYWSNRKTDVDKQSYFKQYLVVWMWNTNGTNQWNDFLRSEKRIVYCRYAAPVQEPGLRKTENRTYV